MGTGRARPADAADPATGLSRPRPGAAACNIADPSALDAATGGGQLGSAAVWLKGDRPTIRSASRSAGRGASMGAIGRGFAPQGAVPLSGHSPLHRHPEEGDTWRGSRGPARIVTAASLFTRRTCYPTPEKQWGENASGSRDVHRRLAADCTPQPSRCVL